MSDLDEPATVIWFDTRPDTEIGRPSNSAHFDTLREAVLFVMRMSVDKRENVMIRTHGGKELVFQDIEAMDKKNKSAEHITDYTRQSEQFFKSTDVSPKRGAPTTDPFRLCGLLQSRTPAHGITERCAIAASRRTVWYYCRHSRSGRITSSICPDMIFGKERYNSRAADTA
jgi:hypothetical protein